MQVIKEGPARKLLARIGAALMLVGTLLLVPLVLLPNICEAPPLSLAVVPAETAEGLRYCAASTHRHSHTLIQPHMCGSDKAEVNDRLTKHLRALADATASCRAAWLAPYQSAFRVFSH